MCDFFDFFFTAIEEQNRVQIFNMVLPRDGRVSSCPDDGTSDDVFKILWFHM